MGIDAQLKRFFPLVLCALIGVAAYFQASGIAQLVAAAVSSGAPDATRTKTSRGAGFKVAKAKSGGAILSRNPFDSVTGPLDGQSSSIPTLETAPSTDAETSDGDPKCNFGRVVLISASPDPDWSFASIQDDKGQSLLRRIGDQVSGHTVQAMGWDRVWLAEGSKRCQLKLGDKSAARKPRPKTGKRRKGRRGRGGLAPELAAKIHKVSDTEFNIERSVVDEILENQAELMRSARISPVKKGDQVLGIKLLRIKKGSLLSHLGLKNGDRLESINGFEMGDPQTAREAYGRLRTASNLKVKINRAGAPMNIDFNIQ